LTFIFHLLSFAHSANIIWTTDSFSHCCPMGRFFGFLKKWFKNRETLCLMLGPDAAGKTTSDQDDHSDD
jgi:hypothetical protein